MKKALLVLIVLVSSLTSCMTYRFEALESDDIQIEYDRGNIIPIYMDESVGMVVVPEYYENNLMIKVFVSNLSNNSILLKDTDFSVFVSDDKMNWEELSVYESNEYYNNAQGEYIVGAILMGLSAGLDSYNAGQGRSSSSGSFYGNTSYGSYSGTYSGSTTYYDPVAAELANQRNAQMISDYSNSGKGWLEYLENNLFYKKTLSPKEDYFGLIFSAKGSGDFYKITCENKDIACIQIEYKRITVQY